MMGSTGLPDVPDQPELFDPPGPQVEVDVVVVWRIVNGRIKDVWDISSVYTLHTPAE